MLDIGTQKPQGKTFSLNLAIRDTRGRIMRYKSIETDSATELHDFWQFNSVQANKKRKVEENKESK